MSAAAYEYKVISPLGQAVMSTVYPSCRYPAEIEAHMLALGYKISVCGKRLTKKEISRKSPI